jgi:hypothetical protein
LVSLRKATLIQSLLPSNTCSTRPEGMDRRLEVEQFRRSIALLSPGARDAVGREEALWLLTQMHDVQGRLDDLKRRGS